MVHFRKAGTAGLLPVGHHQGSGPSDSKFVRLSNAGVMGGGGGSQYGDTGSVGGGDAAQRKNHSQIEKKRRDRMNTYIKVLYSRYLLAFSKFGSEKMCVFKVKLTSKALSVGNDCALRSIQQEELNTCVLCHFYRFSVEYIAPARLVNLLAQLSGQDISFYGL